MNKKCFKCGVVQDIECFYKHFAMADGRLGKCKTCTKKDVSDNYAIKRRQFSEYDRIRYKNPERRKAVAESQRRYRKNNPEKNRCRSATYRALRKGIIQKTPCVYCGETVVQAHHNDYSDPLDVVWCCFRCHREKKHNQIVTSNYR